MRPTEFPPAPLFMILAPSLLVEVEVVFSTECTTRPSQAPCDPALHRDVTGICILTGMPRVTRPPVHRPCDRSLTHHTPACMAYQDDHWNLLYTLTTTDNVCLRIKGHKCHIYTSMNRACYFSFVFVYITHTKITVNVFLIRSFWRWTGSYLLVCHNLL